MKERENTYKHLLRGHPDKKPTLLEKATGQCKSKCYCINFYPSREANSLDKSHFWGKDHVGLA